MTVFRENGDHHNRLNRQTDPLSGRRHVEGARHVGHEGLGIVVDGGDQAESDGPEGVLMKSTEEDEIHCHGPGKSNGAGSLADEVADVAQHRADLLGHAVGLDAFGWRKGLPR